MAAADAAGAPAVDHSAEYTYPLENDGWVKVHDVIRADMVAYLAAVRALEGRLKGGAALQPWEVACLQSWWGNFHHNVQEHHKHEEDIFFPEFQKRFPLPAKMSDDHGALVKGMDECGAMVKALDSAEPNEASLEKVSSLATRFQAFEASMKEHLLEEEKETLPPFRRFFPPSEAKALVERTMKMMGPMDLGWFFHNMSPQERDAFARQEGIPWIVAHWIIFPGVPKFNAEYTAKIAAVTEGKEPVKPKGPFAWLGF